MRDQFTHRRSFAGIVIILLLAIIVPGQRAVGIIDTAESEGITLVAFGESVGDQLRILTSGDFNGDGLADILAGAHLAQNPTIERNDSGSVYIVFGSRNFIPIEILDIGDPDQPKADVVFFGAEEDDRLGLSAARGDLNGDGIDDIILSAPGADGPGNARREAGEVYVFFGGRDLIPGTVRDVAGTQGRGSDITILGEELNDGLGASVTLGDVNGDQSLDLIIGAPGTFGPQNTRARSGTVYVILGGPRLSFPGTIDLADPFAGADIVIHGADPLDGIGFAVRADDLNGDGLDDIVFSAPTADGLANSKTDAGEVYTLFGATGLAATPVRDVAGSFGPGIDLTIYGEDPRDTLGGSLAVGDVSGDGVADLALGAFFADGPDNSRINSGQTYVILGGSQLQFEHTRDLAGQVGRPADVNIFGADFADQLGYSLTIAEANGDGILDVVVGSPLGDGPDNLRTSAGEVFVLFGGNRLFDGFPRDMAGQVGPLANLIVYGPSGATLGASVALGDVDGDTANDLLIGAPTLADPNNLRPNTGAVLVISAR